VLFRCRSVFDFYEELLAKLDKTVTPAEAGVQKSLKNLVPGLRRDDEKGLLQEALK